MGIRTVSAFALLAALIGVIVLRSDGAKTRDASAASSVAAEAADGVPRRILPGSVTAMDWLAALGVEPERCVAVPVQAERWSTIRLDPEAWAARPRYERLTSEVALGFQPDLVLVSSTSSEAAVKRIRMSDATVIEVPEPTTWDGLLAAGEAMADAVGAGEAGERLIASLEARRVALGSRGARRLRVLPYANYGGGGSTSGKGTTLDLALELAGFVNVAVESGIQGYGNLTFEQILALEFDAVLALGDEDMGTSESAESLVNAGALASVAPIQARRFIVLPEALHASGSVSIVDAAEEIARQGDALSE
ncbi:ABC transporter substrate-binding protein [Saltatorellus ferox]